MNLKKVYLPILCIVLCLVTQSSYAQLSGNYTIDPTAAASSSNYQNWASAVGDLLNGSRSDGGSAAGPGISASVTFTVYDTVFNATNIEITAIPGSNPSRRVTFKSAGSDAEKCQLRFASSTANTNDFVLFLNGADYVSFENIGFYRTGNDLYSTVVQIGNDANGNKLDGCLIRGRRVPSSSSLGFNYVYGACIYFPSNADSTEITNCRLLYGYNGIFCATACSDNLYENNVLDTNGSSGMYITSQTRLQIRDNTFNMGDFGPNLGHYTSYGMRIETSTSMQITGNKVYMMAVNAQVVRGVIIASTTSTASNPTLIANNWIVNGGGSGDCTGLALYACNYLNFVNNNVLITSSLTNSAAYYHYPQYTNTFIKLINNNLINKGAGYAYNIPGTNTADLDTMDYNNLYSSGNYLINWRGTNYNNLPSFITASNKDSNSLNVDPGYNNTTDLHVSNISINGKGLRYDWVTLDIDKEVRDTAGPDIGADEFFPIANDAGVTFVDSPHLFCPGTHNVRVRFQNYGYDTLKNLVINWSMNGTAQTPFSWSGNIAPGASSSSIQIGSFSFNANTPYEFKVWSRLPNGVADGKNSNDTLKVVKTAGMSGQYTIGSTNSDFQSFNSAIAGFTSRGICGPITFRVKDGIYNEQLTLLELAGMGASNPIEFIGDSGDSTKVVITLPSTTATGNNNAAVQLRGADYITFESITFERTGANPYAHVVHILNESHHNTFRKCRMLGLRLTALNANAENIWSDQSTDNSNVFEQNTIKYGNNCVLYSGTDTIHESGTVFMQNNFDSSYSSLVSINYNDSIMFLDNHFGNQVFYTASNYSLQINEGNGSHKVNANKFMDPNSDYSIHLLNCAAAPTDKSVMANNYFYKPNGKAMHLENVTQAKAVFNTVHIYGSQTTNAGLNIVTGSSAGIEILNNLFALNGGDAIFVPIGSQVVNCNHNNYFMNNGFAFWGTARTNLNDLQNGNGMDQNSFDVNPYFKQAGTPYIFNPVLKGEGIPVAGVSTDIDGEVRNTNNPDIGADEFELSPEDAGIIEMTAPETAACADIYDLEIVIHNFGSDTLFSADIDWTIQNNAQSTYQWTGALPGNSSDTFVIGSFDFTKTLNPKFSFWTSNPNGKNDPIALNDTLTLNKSMRSLPVANAGQDMTVCDGESALLGPTALPNFSYKWFDINENQLSNISKVTVTPTTKSTYILEVTNTTFGCKKRDSIELDIIANPIVSAGRDTTVCLGESVQIGAPTNSNYIYTWSSNPGNYSSSIAEPVITAAYTANYIVRVVDMTTNCVNRDTMTLTAITPPNAAIFGTLSICEGGEAGYFCNPDNGDTYQWTTDGQLLDGAGTDSINIRWNIPGMRTVKLMQFNSFGCKDSAEIMVNVLILPTANFAIGSDCQGNATVFTNTSSDANSYQWDFGGGNTSGMTSPTYTFDTSGIFDVTLIAIGVGNCADTITKQAEVYPIPMADFTSTKQAGNLYQFTDASTIESGTIVTWAWQFGDGQTSTDQNPLHGYADEGDYNVNLCVTSDRGCSACETIETNVTSIYRISANQSIKVMPNPGVGLYELKSDVHIENISILNATGQVVKEMSLNGAQNGSLDLRDLADGVYVLSVSDGTNWYRIRLIKKS